MGVRAPAWLTWLMLGAMAAVYAGERMFPQTSVFRWVLTGGGALVVLACVFMRFRSFKSAEGDARYVERIFLLCYVGLALSLLGFLMNHCIGRCRIRCSNAS